MSTNFTDVKNDGFVDITKEDVKRLKTNVLELLKSATKEGTQEITIISSEPIFFKSKGVLEPKFELPQWDDDTFNYFLEHVAHERLNGVRKSEPLELNTKFFDTLIGQNNYSKDFAVSVSEKTLRVHVVSVYNGSGTNVKYKYCFTIRVVPNVIPDYKDLNLPDIFEKSTTLTSGLVLLTGHTGSGKTTTIASLVHSINGNPAMRRSILTIEDPIEFVHKSSQAIVLQRAIGINTDNYTHATRDALRQNVDTVVIGELREKEAMDNAIRLAEMGKLVFATVHCNSPSDAIDRIVDEFEGDLQDSVRSRLAEVVVGIMHQNLEVVKDAKTDEEIQIPSASGFLIQKPSQKSELRKDYSRSGIANIIKSKDRDWAFSYDSSYNDLVKKGVIEDTPENKSKLVPR